AGTFSPLSLFSLKNFTNQISLNNFNEIKSAYKDRIVSFEPGEILPDNVLPISAKGHTPGHTAYRLGNLLFAGDVMHGETIQLIDPTINANYDADRAQAVVTRIRLLSYAAANSLTVLGAHIPGNGVIF
ncbi:MAG: MBL fold metallo-hydrolase, partial [Muribaculaceae bacterium]|nr:MBL fold metallo-hydrolase [Muribaculaceae bacterium]